MDILNPFKVFFRNKMMQKQTFIVDGLSIRMLSFLKELRYGQWNLKKLAFFFKFVVGNQS